MTEAPALPAATVLLVRDGPSGLEVFMVVRHGAIAFAGGALVFPGGRVDPEDDALAIAPATALHVAAIRETFEECGVLLACPAGTNALIAADRALAIEAKWRAPLCAGEVDFTAMLAAENLVLATDLLVPYAHWITPRHQSKRFDTHFFLAAAPADQLAAHDGSESVDSVWITAAAALAGKESGQFKLIFPTFLNLKKLGRFATAREALTVTGRTKVVTVMPELMQRNANGTRQMRLPPEADYGGEFFEVDMPAAS